MANDGKQVKMRARAEQRVSRVLRSVREVAKLAKGNSFNDAEVAQMFDAIRNEVDMTQEMFSPQAPAPQKEFRFGAPQAQ